MEQSEQDLRQIERARDLPPDELYASNRDDWPVHQPECYDAPIPGRQWYAGCEPGGDFNYETGNYHGAGPRVNPATSTCESCGGLACPECGRENCPEHL